MEQLESGNDENKSEEEGKADSGVDSVESKLQESQEVLKQLKDTPVDEILGTASESDEESSSSEIGGQEVTAATIGRMLGLATASEIKLLAGKLDLVATRVNTMNSKLEKIGVILSKAPTGSDLDRIDVQIGALRTLIKEALISAFGDKSEGGEKGMKKAKIMSNKE